jgi:hypothetical protein
VFAPEQSGLRGPVERKPGGAFLTSRASLSLCHIQTETLTESLPWIGLWASLWVAARPTRIAKGLRRKPAPPSALSGPDLWELTGGPTPCGRAAAPR